MMIDMEKLWEPYSVSNCSLDQFTSWIVRDCKKRGISEQLANSAIQLVFLELANGKTHSLDGCDCGCELSNAHSAICHYTVGKAIGLDGEIRAEAARVLGGTLNAAIAGHLEEHKVALEEKYKPKPGRVKKAWSALWDPVR